MDSESAIKWHFVLTNKMINVKRASTVVTIFLKLIGAHGHQQATVADDKTMLEAMATFQNGKIVCVDVCLVIMFFPFSAEQLFVSLVSSPDIVFMHVDFRCFWVLHHLYL